MPDHKRKEQIAYRARILTACDQQRPGEISFQYWEDACLIVDKQGQITELGPYSQLDLQDIPVQDLRPAWILPGFIDSHIHFCQLDLIGCYAGELLHWLNEHTFPHEQKLLQNDALVKDTARVFIDQLAINGTTMACIYGPSRKHPTEILFQELADRGMRAILGKTSMDRHAPEGLLDSIDEDLVAHHSLVAAWHRFEERLFYAITPRFAPSCSDELMKALGQFRQDHPEIYVQSHFAENLDELRWVQELYPHSQDYLSVYDSFHLLGPKTILGHGIHVSPRECQALADSGTIIAHCPTSNLFLGSGLCPVSWLRQSGVSLALGTDVGAGTSFSMWQTMAEAYKVAKLRGESLRPQDLFYFSTLGAATTLGLSSQTGSLSKGKKADFQVIDPNRKTLLARRLAQVEDFEQLLFALIHHCDEHCVVATYVDGKLVDAPYYQG